jgi:hypothetical protein
VASELLLSVGMGGKKEISQCKSFSKTLSPPHHSILIEGGSNGKGGGSHSRLWWAATGLGQL